MSNPIYIVNRKAKFDYHFIRTLTAGIKLVGSEVKCIRDSKVTMVDAYCYFDNGELFVKNLNITAIDSDFGHDPTRIKKLLLSRKELDKLEKDLEKGVTIVVVDIHSEKSFIKVNIALAKGKKNYDKRETIKTRDVEREMRRLV